MRNSQIKTLLSVNLRLNNPQITDRARKKGKKGIVLTRYLIRNSILQAVIFMLVYAVPMMTINFRKMPGIFSYYVMLFALLAISMGISSTYNVFFEGEDLPSYLSLPFKIKDVFITKITIVAIGTVPFVLPLLVAFLLVGLRSGVFIPLAIIMALIFFVLFLISALCICSLIVFGLTRTRLFVNHKKLMTTGLLVISMLIMVGGMIFINQKTTNASALASDPRAVAIFMPIYHSLVAPLSSNALLGYLNIGAVTLLVTGLVNWLVLPRLFSQLTSSNSAAEHKHKVRTVRKRSLSAILHRYNRQLILSPNLIMQVFSSTLMTPIIFIVSFAMYRDSLDFATLGNRWFGVFILGGIVLSWMTINQVSFVANLISLDQGNFNFVLALPLSLKKYLRHKFVLGFTIQACLNILIVLLIGIIFKASPVLTMMMMIGTISSTYILSQYYFKRDFRLLNLEWTNVTQLFYRGAGNLGLVITIFAAMIVGSGLVVLYALGVLLLQTIWLDVAVLGALLILGITLTSHYHRTFWAKIEQNFTK